MEGGSIPGLEELRRWPGSDRREPRAPIVTTSRSPRSPANSSGDHDRFDGRRTSRCSTPAVAQALSAVRRAVRSRVSGHRRVRRRVRRRRRRVEALPYADASFDLVLCTQVFEHLDDPATRDRGRSTAFFARAGSPSYRRTACSSTTPDPPVPTGITGAGRTRGCTKLFVDMRHGGPRDPANGERGLRRVRHVPVRRRGREPFLARPLRRGVVSSLNGAPSRSTVAFPRAPACRGPGRLPPTTCESRRSS